MPYLVGVVTPQDYGAVADGVTDCTAAINAAAAAVSTAGGGILFFPEGIYQVTPVSTTAAAIVLNNGTAGFQSVRFVGAGAQATKLRRATAGPILSMSGPSTSSGTTHCKYCSLENIGLDGNSLTGTMLQTYYADNLFFHETYFNDCSDIVQDTAEFWDSRYYNCVWEVNGSTTPNTAAPNVLLRNSAAASGFGASSDNVNQIHFIGCRWEGFRSGAVVVEQGVSNSNNPNGIYLVNCKMETGSVNGTGLGPTSGGGSHLTVDANSKGVCVENLYAYSGGFYPGYSTAQDAISWSPQDGSLDNVFIATGPSQTVANGVTLNSTVAGQTSQASNVTGIYNGLPTGQHIAYGTATGNFLVENCNSNQTPPTTLNAAFNFNGSAFSNALLAGLVSGDTFKRYQLNANGTMLYGSGSAAADNQFNRASSTTMAFSKNVQLGGTTALGDNGVGELQLTNATTVPTTNPTGGLDLYASSGNLYYRNPSGFVTDLSANAVTSTATATTVTGVTTITSLAAGSTIAANTLAAGQVYRFRAWGAFTCTTTQSLTLQLMWGGTGGIQLVGWGTYTPSANQSGAAWSVNFDIVANSSTQITATGEEYMAYFLSTMNQQTSGVTNTASEQLVLAVTPSNVAVSITCDGFYCMRVR